MDDSTSSGSRTETSQDQAQDSGVCSVCHTEIGFGLLLPKRTHCKFCRRLVCTSCSKERAFNTAKNKEQRICKNCLTHMLSQFQAAADASQDETSGSLLQQLEILNTALRQERAKRISLEDEIDTFQVQNDAEESFPELAAQLAEIKAQAEAFARQREDLEHRLQEERNSRQNEQGRLERAQKKLKTIKEKLSKALGGLSPELGEQ